MEGTVDQAKVPVATELFVSINTVEFHLKRIYGKLGIRSREELAEQLARI
jgi:DNA-binding CsgD family transcriptional regulator